MKKIHYSGSGYWGNYEDIGDKQSHLLPLSYDKYLSGLFELPKQYEREFKYCKEVTISFLLGYRGKDGCYCDGNENAIFTLSEPVVKSRDEIVKSAVKKRSKRCFNEEQLEDVESYLCERENTETDFNRFDCHLTIKEIGTAILADSREHPSFKGKKLRWFCEYWGRTDTKNFYRYNCSKK